MFTLYYCTFLLHSALFAEISRRDPSREKSAQKVSGVKSRSALPAARSGPASKLLRPAKAGLSQTMDAASPPLAGQ